MKLPETGQYIKKRILKQRWYKIMLILSSIVVFCTTYALILPAITLEKQCELPEHVHDQSCYSQPEISESHQHTDACYTKERGELICGLHEHTEECWTDEISFICGMEEGQEISKTIDDENISEDQTDNLTIHHHTEECCQITKKLICGIESEHHHSEECYLWEKVLSCGLEETSNENLGSEQVLICGMEEHVHTETCHLSATIQDEDTLLTTEGKTEPQNALNIEPYIKTATLYYKTENNTEWIQITGNETDIPGNASFKLEIEFEGTKIVDLINAGYQMNYTLPELFRNAVVSAAITSGNENVGTMSVKDGLVTLSFSKEWIEKQQSNKNEDLSGKFFLEAEADLTKIPEDGKTEITVGDTIIKINFDQDIIAKYAAVELEKNLIELKEEDDGDYLYYTLSVTAGEDGCTDVVVTDSFTNGKDYIESYVLPEEQKELITIDKDTGIMSWHVGDMESCEVKTLTYKVKLKQGYLGVKPKGNITNNAVVYSGNYQRDTDSVTFEPKGKATLSKASANYIADESGGGTIQYTIWVHAEDSNNYTLDNVTIWDSLDGTVTGGFKTDENVWKYLEYQEFHLYEGGSKNQNGAENLTEILDAEKVQISETGRNFKYSIGNLAPGESKTLIYTLKVDEGVFTTSNENIKIGNRATILTDPTRSDGGNERLENFHTEKTITSKKWARKIVGEELSDKKTISMQGTVQDTNGNQVNIHSFDVPKGSYMYQVTVNETGDWNVSSAVMKDSLHGGSMQYIGYLQINAYRIKENKNYGTDQEAVAALNSKTPAQTIWIEIDGKENFEFHPKDIGFENEQYAYLLSYYAVPKNIGEASTVIVANEFYLTGTVGINGKFYVLTGINVSASVQLQGTNYFSAKKNFWYYQSESVDEDNGNLYWVIQVQGNRIPKGTSFRDVPKKEEEIIRHNCKKIVSAFTSDTIDHFSNYSELSELKEKCKVTEFTDYTEEVSNNELLWTLTSDVILSQNESLYFVILTKPVTLPASNGTYITYGNSLYTKDPVEGAEWVWQSEDQHSIVAGENIYKYLSAVFQVKTDENENDKQVVYVQGDSSTTVLQKDYLEKSGNGIYTAWKVRINQDSTLSGTYRIEEQIPEGMELVYIQRFSTGSGYSERPVFQKIDELTDWKYVEQNFTNDKNPTPAIYYVKGQRVVWEIAGLRADPYQPGAYYAEYLIVCKLVDSDVLLGGETKLFNNQVSLKDRFDNTIGFDTDGVELSAPKISKTGVYNPNVNGGRYPFKIVLNELGTDLMPNADTIQLIDEMNDILILDPTSIKVINQITGKEIAFTSAIEGHTLTLTIPDDQPLVITYEASINAAPGDKITIENNAHWIGYETIPGGSVKNENFSYAAGATVGADTYPTITVTKLDQYNNQLYLKNAKFQLTEMQLDKEGNLLETADGLSLTGTTDENGQLIFGNDRDHRLKCNTVYSLVETEAPEGYVTDDTPHYFLIAKKEVSENGESSYPDYSGYKNVTIFYSSPQYNYTAYNHKGEIAVIKKFENANGESFEKLNGTYTFGLFEQEDAVNPIQTSTITYKNGVIIPKDGIAKFTNVELENTYWIYELDDEGKPIKNAQEGKIDKVPFVVSYENNRVFITDETPKQEVVVTNRINYAELPNSGGSGNVLYMLSGSFLIFTSFVLLYYQKKRKNEDFSDGV